MENVSKQEVEKAIRAYKAATIQKAEIEGAIKDAEEVIEAYSLNHIGEFADGRLPMDEGVIAIKAGAAKPLKEGKPLPTVARSELAAALPPAYVKSSCDFTFLFNSQDKTVRQILASRGIEIVREDKFVVL